MMPETKNRELGYVFFVLIFIGVLLAVFKWAWITQGLLAAYFIFIPIAAYIFYTSRKTSKTISTLCCLKIWGVQGLALAWIWLFALDWYGLYHIPVLTVQYNYNIVMAALAVIFISLSMVMMLNNLAQRATKDYSFLLFVPQRKAHEALITRAFFWLRRGNVWALLLLWNLSFIMVTNSLSNLSHFFNPVAVLVSMLIVFAMMRGAWFHHLLLTWIKKYRWSYLRILLSALAVILVLSLPLQWLLKPMLMGITVNLINIKTLLPQFNIIAAAIVITPFFIVVLGRMTRIFSSRMLLLITCLNPLLWFFAMVGMKGYWTASFNLLVNSSTITIILNGIAFLLISYLLASSWFAKTVVFYFGNQPEQHRGPMPRLLIKNTMALQFELMAIFLLQAPFLLQLSLLSITTGLLIIYVWCFWYYVRLRRGSF